MTGVSGFIASRVVVELLEQGHEVVGSMRSLKREESMRAIFSEHCSSLDKLSFVALNLLSDEGWEAACQGMDYVLHIASPVPVQTPKDDNDIIQPAVQGAKRALNAASKAGVKRVVLTSSVAAIMYGHNDGREVFSEEDWSNPLDAKDNSAYTKSKTLAERAAWEFIEQDNTGLELAVVNPGMVLGPIMEADYGASPIVVKKLLEGAFPGTPKIGFPTIDVRDVADLHITAMTHPKAAGERFIAANGFMWMKDVSKVLKDNLPASESKKVPTKDLPIWLMRILANFDKEAKSVAFELGKKRDAINDKAKDLLGWNPRANSEAVLATAETLKKFGALK